MRRPCKRCSTLPIIADQLLFTLRLRLEPGLRSSDFCCGLRQSITSRCRSVAIRLKLRLLLLLLLTWLKGASTTWGRCRTLWSFEGPTTWLLPLRLCRR